LPWPALTTLPVANAADAGFFKLDAANFYPSLLARRHRALAVFYFYFRGLESQPAQSAQAAIRNSILCLPANRSNHGTYCRLHPSTAQFYFALKRFR
jgi:hypothetical protein